MSKAACSCLYTSAAYLSSLFNTIQPEREHCLCCFQDRFRESACAEHGSILYLESHDGPGTQSVYAYMHIQKSLITSGLAG